ncbi:MAG: P-type conjugative transfer protein TrbG [Pseudomonadota bacterium]
MTRLILTVSTLALLSGCATTDLEPFEPLSEGDFIAATAIFEDEPARPIEIVETTVALPLPGQMKQITSNAETRTVTPHQAIYEGRKSALIEPSVDGYVNAIQVYPYTEGALYRLYASPGQVSDITLQPGETLVSVSAGDTVRWVVGDTISGTGPNSRAHVLVKPINSDIRTNLMIATDRRTYHLELESVPSGYMAALSWRYPVDELAELTSRNARAISREAGIIERGVSLDGLNFDYRISGDRPNWKPVRVFDDGRQVYIQMPDDIETTDLPPLFVLGGNGDAQLVNYRLRGKYYIVDHLFEAAELRLGETPQTIVRISKAKPRTGFAALFGG